MANVFRSIVLISGVQIILPAAAIRSAVAKTPATASPNKAAGKAFATAGPAQVLGLELSIEKFKLVSRFEITFFG